MERVERPAGTGPAARLRGLSVHVDTGRWAETVVRDVDLDVPTGGATALLGHSGAGKSMLARAIGGDLPPTAVVTGECVLGGESVYVPQEGADYFAPDRTVGARLREIAGARGTDLEEGCARAHYPMDRMELLPAEHSGGEIDRAALAAGFLSAPELLILDEPSASVDDYLAARIWQSIRDYALGATVLVITSDLGLMQASGAVDRMAMMEAGRLVAVGSAAEISASDDPRIRGFLDAYLLGR